MGRLVVRFSSVPAVFVAAVISVVTVMGMPGIGVADDPGAVAGGQLRELQGLRTATSRTFVDEETGRRVTRVFEEPVNFRDVGGEWRAIDNTLMATGRGGGWRNAANRYSVALPADAGGGPVRVTEGGAWLEFGLRGAVGAGAVDGSSVRYDGVRDGVSVVYTAQGGGVKEEIVLDSPKAGEDLAFDLGLSAGLSPRVEQDGSVVVRDGEGRVRFVVPAPFMADAAPDAEISHAVSYELERTNAGGHVLRVAPSQAWLRATSRLWPVTIDPTVKLPDPDNDCTIASNVPTTSACFTSPLQVGYDAANHGAHDHRALLRFGFFDSLPERAVLLSAELHMKLQAKTTSNAVPVGVHAVQSSFNAPDDRPWESGDVTWNEWKDGSAWTTAGGDFDAAALATADVGASTGWYTWYLNPHVMQESVNGMRTDNGLLVKTPGAAGAANYLQFYSGDATASNRPFVELHWEARVGSKPEYSFESQRLNDRMGVSVNVATGNLTLAANDLSIKGTGLDFGLSRTFDSHASWGGSRLGDKWATNLPYDVALDLFPDGSAAFYAPGRVPIAFHKTGANKWKPTPGFYGTLATEGAGYKLTMDETLETWHFNSAGKVTAHKDRNANTLGFAYDGSGSLDAVTDTQGRVIDFGYDGNGRLDEVEDNSGRKVFYGYDGSGRLSTYTDAAGKVTEYVWGQEDLAEIEDPLGNETWFDYDGEDRLVGMKRVTNPGTGAGPEWEFDYDTADNRCPARTLSNTMTDPRGKVTTWCHDRAFRVVKTIDPNGNAHDFEWSPSNTLISATAPGAAKTTMKYDGIDNLTQLDSPAGERSKSEYKAAFARLPSLANGPQGTGRVFAYDTSGNTTLISDSGSPTQVDAKLEYNGQAGGVCPNDPTTRQGTLRCAIDGKGNQTRYEYDDPGNLVKVVPELPLSPTTITKDALSRVQTIKDGKGQTRTYTYDAMDRATQIKYSNGETIEYDYDPNGNLTERDDSIHGVSSYAYDELNRRIEDDLPSGSTDYEWDGASNLVGLTDAGGTVDYGYDDANRLISLAEPGGSCTAPVSLCTTFGYTSRDQRETTTYPNGVVRTVTRDASDKPMRIKAVKGATVLTDFAYTYKDDAAGLDTALLRTVTDKNGNTTTYGYDFLDRLKSAVERNGSAVVIDNRSYKYDKASNLIEQTINGTTVTKAYNAANQLCWQYVGSSAAGCLSPPGGATTYSYDANGNLTDGTDSLDLDYNIRNQTTKYGWASGTIATFGYAGPGQSERTSLNGTAQHNTLLGLSREGTTSWVREPDGALIAQNSNGTRHYYLFDTLGSVAGLANSTGTLAQTYRYEPWGQTTSSTGNVTNPFQYTGAYRAAVSTGGLYHNGARYYSPGLQSWTQLDPLDQAGDLREGNRYAYVAANPVNFVDPTGTECQGVFAKAWCALEEAVFGPASTVASQSVSDCVTSAGLAFAFGEVSGRVARIGATPDELRGLRAARRLIRRAGWLGAATSCIAGIVDFP